MLLRLPSNLHYPITIIQIEARVGDTVALNDKLFLYSYTTLVKQGQRNSDEEEEVEKKFITHFESTLEGTIQSWRVWEGDVLSEPVDVCEVEEECPHTVQYLGMCTNCGRDMTVSQPGGTQDTNRATIQPLHDTQHLTISQDEANEIDKEAKRRLLASRKLSLVVDLDQTIIHAAVDPTIGEWQKDKDNPNYDAVKDVRAFQLIDEGPGMRGCWYYIKLRPGLQEFLENISQLYELHIYTMGTRQYAQQIANIVDPDRIFFSDRILSRDESGSMVAKNLERLFPVDTKMVVIIDDRGDVWKWSANLIRVTPFDFFVGIGDINSSFLPKKQEIQATPVVEKDSMKNDEAVDVQSANHTVAADEISVVQNGTSALEQLVAMSGSDDPALREIQSKGQEEIIVSQLEEKPLLRMQQQLDERDSVEAATNSDVDGSPTALTEESPALTSTGSTELELDPNTPGSSTSSTTPTSTPAKSTKARHSILKNDDEELIHLENRLTAVHTAFYNEYDRKRTGTKGGRVGALAGKRKQPVPDTIDGEDSSGGDLSVVPDIKKVLPNMKMRVLANVVIVFSGVLPLGTNIQTADISTWAKTFGARITDKISREVTHVIAARVGTAKVKQAVKRNIKVVGTNWLISSIQQWRRLDERPFLLEGTGQKKSDLTSSDIEHDIEKDHLINNDFMLSSSDEEGNETGPGDTDADGNADEDEEGGSLFGDSTDTKQTNGAAAITSTENGVTTQPPLTIEIEDSDRPRKRLKLNISSLSALDKANGTSISSTRNKSNTRPANANGTMPSTTSTDDEDNLIEDGSPITINQDDWDDMDAELKEFMGSDVDSESDTDSVSSKLSLRDRQQQAAQAKKRKRGNGASRNDGEDTATDNDEEESDAGGGARKSNSKVVGGGSALKTVKNVASEGGDSERSTPAAPASGSTTNINASPQAKGVDIANEDEESSDDELARELERELEGGSDDDEG